MTLPPDTGFEIRLRPNTLPLGHGGSPKYLFITTEWVRNILQGRVGLEPANPTFQAALTTAPGPPPYNVSRRVFKCVREYMCVCRVLGIQMPVI